MKKIKNAQLLFTTHASNLLDLNLMNDQIRVVTKDERGISKIANLSKRDNNRIKNTTVRSRLWATSQYEGSVDVSMEDIEKIIIG